MAYGSKPYYDKNPYPDPEAGGVPPRHAAVPPSSCASITGAITKALGGIVYEAGLGAGAAIGAGALGLSSLSTAAAVAIGATAMPAATLAAPPVGMLAHSVLSYIEERPFMVRLVAMLLGGGAYWGFSTPAEFQAINKAFHQFIERATRTEEVFLSPDDAPLVSHITEYLNIDPSTIVGEDTVSQMLIALAKAVKAKKLVFPADARTVFSAADPTALDPEPIHVPAFTAATPESGAFVPPGYRDLPTEFLEGGEYAKEAAARTDLLESTRSSLKKETILSWKLIWEITVIMSLMMPKAQERILEFGFEKLYKKVCIDIPGLFFDDFLVLIGSPQFSDLMGRYMHFWAGALEKCGLSHTREIELAVTHPTKLAELLREVSKLRDERKLGWWETLKQDACRTGLAFSAPCGHMPPPIPNATDEYIGRVRADLYWLGADAFRRMNKMAREAETARRPAGTAKRKDRERDHDAIIRLTGEAVARDRFEKYGSYSNDELLIDCLYALPDIFSHLSGADGNAVAINKRYLINRIAKYFFLTPLMKNEREVKSILFKYAQHVTTNPVTEREMRTLFDSYFGGKLSWFGSMQFAKSRPQMWHDFKNALTIEAHEIREAETNPFKHFLVAIGDWRLIEAINIDPMECSTLENQLTQDTERTRERCRETFEAELRRCREAQPPQARAEGRYAPPPSVPEAAPLAARREVPLATEDVRIWIDNPLLCLPEIPEGGTINLTSLLSQDQNKLLLDLLILNQIKLPLTLTHKVQIANVVNRAKRAVSTSQSTSRLAEQFNTLLTAPERTQVLTIMQNYLRINAGKTIPLTALPRSDHSSHEINPVTVRMIDFVQRAARAAMRAAEEGVAVFVPGV